MPPPACPCRRCRTTCGAQAACLFHKPFRLPPSLPLLPAVPLLPHHPWCGARHIGAHGTKAMPQSQSLPLLLAGPTHAATNAATPLVWQPLRQSTADHHTPPQRRCHTVPLPSPTHSGKPLIRPVLARQGDAPTTAPCHSHLANPSSAPPFFTTTPGSATTALPTCWFQQVVCLQQQPCHTHLPTIPICNCPCRVRQAKT